MPLRQSEQIIGFPRLGLRARTRFQSFTMRTHPPAAGCLEFEREGSNGYPGWYGSTRSSQESHAAAPVYRKRLRAPCGPRLYSSQRQRPRKCGVH